jgi:rsbT antagonist protein RsbS
VTDTPSIPLIRLFDILIVSIQVALSDALMDQLTKQITEAIERSPIAGVVLDLSGTDVMDSHITTRVRDLAMTARLMGVKTVICGLRASVVITLVEMGLGIPGIRSALNLERALEVLLLPDLGSPGASRRSPSGDEPAEDPDEREAHVVRG